MPFGVTLKRRIYTKLGLQTLTTNKGTNIFELLDDRYFKYTMMHTMFTTPQRSVAGPQEALELPHEAFKTMAQAAWGVNSAGSIPWQIEALRRVAVPKLKKTTHETHIEAPKCQIFVIHKISHWHWQPFPLPPSPGALKPLGARHRFSLGGQSATFTIHRGL